MATFSTVNPATGGIIQSYTLLTENETREKIACSLSAFEQSKKLSVAERSKWAAVLGGRLLHRKNELAAIATLEMGKPIAQAIQEIEKCARLCTYYSENAERFLADVAVRTESSESFVSYRPLGPVFCIMPWNFPYWQVFRFAVPALLAGNSVVAKHAPATTACGLAIEMAFAEAGLPNNLFQTVIIDHEMAAKVISHDSIRAVSLTGSDRAGKQVASIASLSLKKAVLELGGSDAYVVLDDADLEQAAKVCVDARFVNGGQSCVAAKRFIVTSKNYDEFTRRFIDLAKNKRVGDPTVPTTDIGPMARVDLRDLLHQQITASVRGGAKILLGCEIPKGAGFYYPVSALGDVKPGMPAFDQETFGPVAAFIRAENENEALQLANRSRYGLGAAVFSKNLNRAREIARNELDAGFCTINSQVKSDPRLPFGGIKDSGYGRELSEVGIKEFVNVKTVTRD